MIIKGLLVLQGIKIKERSFGLGILLQTLNRPIQIATNLHYHKQLHHKSPASWTSFVPPVPSNVCFQYTLGSCCPSKCSEKVPRYMVDTFRGRCICTFGGFCSSLACQISETGRGASSHLTSLCWQRRWFWRVVGCAGRCIRWGFGQGLLRWSVGFPTPKGILWRCVLFQ